MKKRSGLIRSFISIFVFILLECVSIVMITNDSIVQRYKIMGIIRNYQTFFWQQKEDVKYYFNLSKINDQLVTENTDLKKKITKYEGYLSNRDSILLSDCADYSYLPATIVKNSINKQHNYIIINKGSSSGVKKGMGVITDSGVVGVVNSVSNNLSYVISFLNTSQSVSGKIAKTNHFGPMLWKGTTISTAVLTKIPIHTKVNIGDTIVTSGYSAIFPAEIPLGIIKSTKTVYGISQDIDVSMFQDFRSLRFVNVVINRKMGEITELENEK